MALRILCASAHPADMFDLAGGTLIQHAEAGDEVHLLSLSPGAYSHSASLLGPAGPDMTYDEVEKIKLDEFQAAADKTGARSWRALPHKDEPLEIDRQLILDVARVIREVRPDIMITHHQGEMNHHDHGPAGLAVLRAATTAARWAEGLDLPRHLVPAIYFFGSQFRAAPAVMGWQPVPPSHVIDITSSVDRKIEALKCFTTQNYDADYANWRREKVDGGFAYVFGLQYAEWFISLTPTVGLTLTTYTQASMSRLLKREKK